MAAGSLRLTVLAPLLYWLFFATPSTAQTLSDNTGDDDVLSQIRGVVEPTAKATISSEMLGRIVSMPFREGQRFSADDVLVRFDCALQKAELAGAEAERAAKRKTEENYNNLLKRNAIGGLEVELAMLASAVAAANVRIAAVKVSRCEIRAPFDGRVVSAHVNEHETASPGKELLTVLNHREMKIELIVPSSWLSWLKRETEFEFTVDETGNAYPASVSDLGASVDPVSQTVRVIGRFANHPVNVVAGMSGVARFSQNPQ